MLRRRFPWGAGLALSVLLTPIGASADSRDWERTVARRRK